MLHNRRRVTVADVAECLGCSISTVDTMIKRRQLPPPQRLTPSPRSKRVWQPEVIEPALAALDAGR